MKFKVFAGNMYCGMLGVAKDIQVFKAEYTNGSPVPRVKSYKKLRLQRIA